MHSVVEHNYLNLLKHIIEDGELRKNRTGIATSSVTGTMLKHDLRQGFPLLTTKAVPMKPVTGELIGFIRGETSAAAFRELGAKIWDANANDNESWKGNAARKGRDDLGRIYGAQWRGFTNKYGGHHDQLWGLTHQWKSDPTSRRLLVTAWNPAEIHECALPPCHVLWQVVVNEGTDEFKRDRCFDLCVYMRSVDVFLGLPFNLASYALLAELLSLAMGYQARHLTVFMADTHLYENHFDQVNEQLRRAPRQLPELAVRMEPGDGGDEEHWVSPHEWWRAMGDDQSSASLRALGFEWLVDLTPAEVRVEGYDPLPALKAPMAV